MKISVRWLNEYLSPGPAPPSPVTAEEAEHALTFAGFPIESATKLADGDICLDVEVTSNRGDVLSHIGVAREVATLTGRVLKLPAADAVFNWSPTAAGEKGTAISGDVNTVCAVDNRLPDLCKLFTARVIKGVKVGPSPKWLVDALASVGQRSINNVVDVTNFVGLEYGQPSHVFDLGSVGKDASGRAGLIVRLATKGEKLKLLDGKTIALVGDEMVVADTAQGGRAVSLAGVMGGAETEVGAMTTDVILEAATWEPVAVRRAARRFNIRTDASYRFERIVDARTIERAASRAAALIVRLAGGTLVTGVISAGPSHAASTPIRLRPTRVERMLGVAIARERMVELLRALDVEVGLAGEGADLICTPPTFRPDLTREIDLIEEVARVHGLDKLPVNERVAVRVSPPQPTELAMREVARVLTGAGFYEAVTFTFVGPKQAKPFLPNQLTTVEVCDERRKTDPVLRPSAIPSLLACRRANQDGGVSGDGAAGVRLYETSAVFAQVPPAAKGVRGKEVESRNLALLADASFPDGAKLVERKQAGVRAVRGVIESIVQTLGGTEALSKLEVVPDAVSLAAFDPGASAAVRLDGQMLGVFGVLSDAIVREYDLAIPLVAAELNLDQLVAIYPPRARVHTLPQFPSIERDLSLVVGEGVAWASIQSLVRDARVGGQLPQIDDFWFVGTYRGQPLAQGTKSVTLRMRFRDPSDARTLRHEEVDPQVTTLVDAAKQRLGATLRG